MNPFQSPQYVNQTSEPGPIVIFFALVGIIMNVGFYIFSMLWPLLLILRASGISDIPWAIIILAALYNLTFSYYLIDLYRRRK